jgi:hypothetical protein
MGADEAVGEVLRMSECAFVVRGGTGWRDLHANGAVKYEIENWIKTLELVRYCRGFCPESLANNRVLISYLMCRHSLTCRSKQSLLTILL